MVWRAWLARVSLSLLVGSEHCRLKGLGPIPFCCGALDMQWCGLQVITESMGEKYLAMKLKEQGRAIAMLAEDGDLAALRQVQAPLLDLEVRGLPALQYFGGQMWRDTLPEMSAGARAEGRSGSLAQQVTGPLLGT